VKRGPIKEFFLAANPNPGRQGCPGKEVLRAIALNQVPSPFPARLHLAECSHCFSEFLELKHSLEENRHHRWRILGVLTAAAIIVIILALAGYRAALSVRHKPSQLIATTVTPLTGVLNFHNAAQFRGTTQPANAKSSEQILSSSVHDLLIILAEHTEVGPYEVELRNSDGETISQSQGTAELDADKLNRLKTTMNFAGIKPGEYTLAWRPRGEVFWTFGSFVIQ
jgi:hypothetical protein